MTASHAVRGAAIAAWLCSLSAEAVRATTIDFDDASAPCNFVETVALRGEYSGMGVTFSAPGNDGGAIIDECGNFEVTGHSSPNFLAFNDQALLSDGGVPQDPESILFSAPYPLSVRLKVGAPEQDGFAAGAFDATDALIDSRSLTLSDVMTGVRLSAPSGIAKVVITGPTLFVVDDLEFSSLLCGDEPPGGCKAAGKSLLQLKNDPTDDAKDKLTFKFLNGAAIALAELGNPTAASDYTLCLYAGSASASVDLPAGSHWSAVGDQGFKYRDPSGFPKALVKSGPAGKSKAFLKGKGVGVPDDLPPQLPLPVTAVLVNSENGICFKAAYDSGDVISNDAGRFKAKAQ